MKTIRITKNIEDPVEREEVENFWRGRGIALPCPICSEKSTMIEGDNTCPHCGKTIEVVVNYM